VWQVQVRRHGSHPITRTFRLKADADLWGRQREAEIDRGDLPVDHRALRAITLANLLERYRDTVTPRKRGAAQERYKLRVLLAHSIAQQSLERLTAAEIAAYRDQRLAVVAGGTVRRELAVLQHCLEVARNEWGVRLTQNPLDQIELPAQSPSRERRATPIDPQDEAIMWLRRAAEGGHVEAQWELANAYWGRSISYKPHERDFEEAVTWWERAAENGQPNSQWQLGTLYERGQGVPREYSQAYKWHELATMNLSAKSAEHDQLLKIWADDRKTLSDKMSSQQIVEAERLVREWLQRHAGTARK
jgi:TPR repeat protein